MRVQARKLRGDKTVAQKLLYRTIRGMSDQKFYRLLDTLPADMIRVATVYRKSNHITFP